MPGTEATVGAASNWPEPLSVLAFRAISDRVCGRFQLLSVLLCGAIRAKGTSDEDDRFKMCCILTYGVISDYIRHQAIERMKEPHIDLLGNLPEDVLCTILSKLPLDEVVRTSAVSRRWRKLWTICPKLSFGWNTMYGRKNCPEKLPVITFIRNVNKVLAQCRGKFVEEFAVRINMNRTLVQPLNNWFSHAVSSRAKALVFDLAPEVCPPTCDRYKFPFELLDKDSIRCLQKFHLSYVDFRPPMQFSGFPNLRELDLNLVKVNGVDVARMLSNCCNLERLCIVRCQLKGELAVKGPLPRLLYLKIVSCKRNANIAFHAVNLATFEYRGIAVRICNIPLL